MPRIPHGQQAGFVYHVIKRGNGRATIFHKPQDYFALRLFQTFQTFNRCAPFKACRGSKFKVQEFKVFFHLNAFIPQTQNRGDHFHTRKNRALPRSDSEKLFFKTLGQEAEERISGNQLRRIFSAARLDSIADRQRCTFPDGRLLQD